jgi:hypothetical protein
MFRDATPTGSVVFGDGKPLIRKDTRGAVAVSLARADGATAMIKAKRIAARVIDKQGSMPGRKREVDVDCFNFRSVRLRQRNWR